MKLEKGYKLCLSKEKGKSTIEITRHKDPIMDNFFVLNSIGSSKYQDVWIIENDLDNWISNLKNEGFIKININEDVESLKKINNKKK